jgi:hypothetical protein
MELIADLLKILIPASLVLYGMYLTVQSFISRQLQEKELDIKQKLNEHTLPLQLQAYERLILFLERITPNQLLLRLQPQSVQVADFLQLLLSEIREEYNHNLAQQLYVSHENWQKLTKAKDGLVAMVQQAATEVSPDAAAIELSKKVIEKSLSNNDTATIEAIIALKEEAQKLFK